MPDIPKPACNDTATDRGPEIRSPGTPEGVRQPDGAPLELTSLVGREREVADVGGLLADHRLLTLTGPGGSGKTRLASAVAFEVLGNFEDGAWWVELAAVSDQEMVPHAVARILNVPETPGRSLTEAIAEDLRGLDILLVLDNCEHLVRSCALLAEALLRACPTLVILATSREALGLRGEKVFPVPPLSVPQDARLADVEALGGYGAVRLFVDRAREFVPGFGLTEANAAAVARLCRKLDGMPLAIELAAARMRVMSAEQISTRLGEDLGLLSGGGRTSEARQRTLRAAIDWSHDLLADEERILLRRPSVFSGGLGLEDTEVVCGAEGIGEGEVLDLLTNLVDKSLVSVIERDKVARFSLLETLRRYALEKLERSGEAARIKRRHAEHYLALAEEAEADLEEQEAWLGRLELEHDNLRAALSWALGPEEAGSLAAERAELGLRLAAALGQGRFWAAFGPNEGLRWLERGLAASGSSPSPVRAKALSQAGYLAIWRGDYRGSAALLEEGKALYEELGDKVGVATSLFHLGNMALHVQDRERAEALRSEAEALRGELTDRQAKGLLLYFLGFAALAEGDHDQAEVLCAEGLGLNRQIGDLRGTIMCLTVLGVSALERGDAGRAEALYEEDLRLLRRLKDKTGVSYGLRGMACVAVMRGDAARAARLWGADEALREAIGLSLSPFDQARPGYEGLLGDARRRLGDETSWEAALAEGRAMAPEEALEYALFAESSAAATPEGSSSSLSGRETEVLALVAEGLTNAQVASRLYLSPHTVNRHLRSVYRKLGVSSRTAAAREALERGLI